MKIEGKLHLKNDTVQVSDKFKKREFVIEYVENPMYPQHVLFQLTQDKVDLIDNYEVGQQLEVTFNLRGRKWQSPDGVVKYFNTLEAWRLEPVQSGQNVPPPPAEPAIMNDMVMEKDDDLPF